MRVIAGKARRLNLKTIEGLETRPTTDRLKETLFNMIQNEVIGANFLDLFSGSGAIGIEALSRGAKNAWFVENNKKCTECIRENLRFTKLADDAVVMECDVLTALNRLEGKVDSFDIIFMDPPYSHEHEKTVLSNLISKSYVTEDTLIIVEAELHTEFDYLADMGYEIVKNKEYKTNKHVFIKKIR